MKSHSLVTLVPVITLGTLLTGCAGMQNGSSRLATAETDPSVSSLNQQINELQASLEQERMKRQRLETAMANVKPASGSETLPPGAKPGECYARVFIPPQYKTETEQVLRSDASEKVDVIPARFEMADERVLVKEASSRLEVIPATYETITERVLVKPASTRLEPVPAQYETRIERILDKPEHTVWKKGTGPITKIDESTGEIMCLVTVPASYKTIEKRVLVKPASTREVPVAAEYKTITKRVMKSPPTTRTIEIPAEYKTVKVRKMVEPPQTSTTPIPAKYETITKRSKISDGGVEWRPVLCKTNMSDDLVMRLQNALARAGHNPGPIDGILGRNTMAAVKSYQQSKGLPTGGLTIQTLSSLNVNP